MKRIFSYTITAPDSEQHIRTWLKQHPGSVRLNGKEALFYFPLKTGDLLEITLEEEQPSENIIPVCLPLHIIYEDEDLMVIDKPADMPVHPSIGNYENTLANAVAWYFQQQNIPFVFRCINRLDRDTTGLLIIAKNALSGAILSQMMKDRQIRRTYLAIVKGIPPECGTIDAPIGRVPGSLLERQVDFLHGETAVTHFQTLQQHKELALVQLRLETGRTHQIRVHMASTGHPLLGDTLYHSDDKISSCASFSRAALHAWKVSFQHPFRDEMLLLEAPLPFDFRELVSLSGSDLLSI